MKIIMITNNMAKYEEEKDLGVIFDKYLSFDAHNVIFKTRLTLVTV